MPPLDSPKRFKFLASSSARRIRKARKALLAMPMEQQIDLIVAAGSMTQAQADKAKKKLHEINEGRAKTAEGV